MTRHFVAGEAGDRTCEDPAADDPDMATPARDSHRDSASTSSSSSSQSTLDEWPSAGSGATAPAGDSPPASPQGGDYDALAEANAEQIDTLTATLDWLAKVVADRTDPPGEAPASETGETADRGFQ